MRCVEAMYPAAQLDAACEQASRNAAEAEPAQPVEDVLSQRDRWFLCELKAALCAGLQAFERHGPRVRELGAPALLAACRGAAQLVEDYHAQIFSELGLVANTR